MPPIKDINAALLRTCRAIYEETFPILYGNNRFVFHRPSQITEFAFGTLCFPLGRHFLDSPFGNAFKCNVRILAVDITGIAMSQSRTPTIPRPKIPRIDTNICLGKIFDASFHDLETKIRPTSAYKGLGGVLTAIIRAPISHLSCPGRLVS